MKKEIIVDLRAKKEIQQFPIPVQLEILNLISVLEQGGMLDEPDGKKLSGRSNLFEMRIRYKGQWRVVYSYYSENQILLLAAFQKKTQKTPLQIIKKAIRRLHLYS